MGITFVVNNTGVWSLPIIWYCFPVDLANANNYMYVVRIFTNQGQGCGYFYRFINNTEFSLVIW